MAAQRVFRALSSSLRMRHAGCALAAAPDWIDPEAIESLSLDLPGTGDGLPVLRVALRDGFTARGLPRNWALPDQAQPTALTYVRAARASAQAAPGVERTGTHSMLGTAACLVRDRLAPQRNYLVTCGHVMAPTEVARAADRASIRDGTRNFDGYLVEWQPAHGKGVLRTRIDAALIEVTPADAVALQRNSALLPHGLSSTYGRGMMVTLQRRSTPSTGSLRIFWSGHVRLPVPDADEYPEYFLDDAIGYQLQQPSEPGDSGAAVWNRSKALLGLHIGSIDDAPADAPNAILGRIHPVLEWFNVKPYLVSDPATLDDAAGAVRDARPIGATTTDAAELQIVAQTLYGEASSEREEGMRAVGSVILNRVKRGGYGKTFKEVCLRKKHFSCWNPGDANGKRMQRAAQMPDATYTIALRIADLVCARTLQDTTRGALHYHVVGTYASWVQGHRPCAVIGRHAFYNDIDG